MKLKDKNNRNLLVIRIDESLDKFNKMILFPEKVEAAAKMLDKVGLPRLRRSH